MEQSLVSLVAQDLGVGVGAEGQVYTLLGWCWETSSGTHLEVGRNS